MEKKKIFIVTNGDKITGPNPPMNAADFSSVERLKKLIPSNPELVACGTGRRHEDIRLGLGLETAKTVWTELVGGPESLIMLDGHRHILLADGRIIPMSSYMSPAYYAAPSLLGLLNEFPDNTVICSGCSVMAALGKKDAEPLAVYCVTFEGVATLSNLEICEVKAPGVTEAGTV